MSFKLIRGITPEAHELTFCDGVDHVLIVPPKNAYAHEAYEVSLKPCKCVKPVPTLDPTE